MISAILFLLFVAIGYLSGSVCSAVIVSRIFDLPDPRTAGSKNPGATNVLRLAGKKYAVIVLIADMLKGFIPVVLASLFTSSPVIVGFTCFAAVMGHMYPVFFDFKGGKGVATAVGALFGLDFMLGIVVAGLWLLIANFTRYSSLASILSIILMPILAVVLTQNVAVLPPLALIMLFILYQHRENLTRLMDGTEPKIKFHHHDISDIAEQLLNTKEKKAHVEEKPTATKTAAPKKAALGKTGKTAKATKKAPAKTAGKKATPKKVAPKKATKPAAKTAKKKPATKS